MRRRGINNLIRAGESLGACGIGLERLARNRSGGRMYIDFWRRETGWRPDIIYSQAPARP